MLQSVTMPRSTKLGQKAELEAALELVRAWGRAGGKKGAKARWSGVSADERRALAKKAAAARWKRVKRPS